MNLREHERASIRAFVQRAADEGYLSGRVLDYGCGRQPYRDIVEAAGGEYVGFDRAEFPANASGGDAGPAEVLYPHEEWDAILCTQVVQYLPIARNAGYPEHWPLILYGWQESLKADGHLVLTYPTCWPEVEPEDLHRFTKAGMERQLTEAGFTILRHDRRAYVFGAAFDIAPGKITRTEDEFALGYGVVARA